LVAWLFLNLVVNFKAINNTCKDYFLNIQLANASNFISGLLSNLTLTLYFAHQQWVEYMGM